MDDSNKEIITPWSTVGLLVYKRTYARTKNDGSVEEWRDTIDRVVRAANEGLGCGFSGSEQDRLRAYLTNLRCSVAGRFLWQLGSPTVRRLGLASLQNCAFTVVDKPSAFTWAFDMLNKNRHLAR